MKRPRLDNKITVHFMKLDPVLHAVIQKGCRMNFKVGIAFAKNKTVEYLSLSWFYKKKKKNSINSVVITVNI